MIWPRQVHVSREADRPEIKWHYALAVWATRVARLGRGAKLGGGTRSGPGAVLGLLTFERGHDFGLYSRAAQGGAGAAADVDGSSTEGVAGGDEDEDEVRTGSGRWGG